jgi:alpha-tubulin suppressor-like RCC1 family protein
MTALFVCRQLGLASKVLTEDENERSSWTSLVPKLVPNFMKNPVKMIACGNRFTAVVTCSGQVWAWGEGGSGQLGYGRTKCQPYPKMVLASSPNGASKSLRLTPVQACRS